MSQKIENMLNLALEATEDERERSGQLNVGYDPFEREWELIVKYSGELDSVQEIAVSVTELMNGYAVLVVSEARIDELAALPGIDFIEKPKSLYFQADVGRQVSCIDTVQREPLSLSGRGVLVGVVDSGIDITNPNFRHEDGSTRIAALWDQSAQGRPPEGYDAGSEYTREELNGILRNEERSISDAGGEAAGTRPEPMPGNDLSGHGTAVAGIAAGNGSDSPGARYRGAAPESELIVVKMRTPRQDGFPRTTELMTGVDYIIRKALEMRMPVAVNISFGYPFVTAPFVPSAPEKYSSSFSPSHMTLFTSVFRAMRFSSTDIESNDRSKEERRFMRMGRLLSERPAWLPGVTGISAC